jgi:hypothetical protein
VSFLFCLFVNSESPLCWAGVPAFVPGEERGLFGWRPLVLVIPMGL